MADDGRRETLRRYVAELLALESDLEAAVDRQRETARAHADVEAAVERFHGMIRGQRDALRAYLKYRRRRSEAGEERGRALVPGGRRGG